MNIQPRNKWQKTLIDAMQLQSFAPKTQYTYFRAVRKLSDFYNKPPYRITEEELCQYFLHRKNVDQWSETAFNHELQSDATRSAANSYSLCAIRFETFMESDCALWNMTIERHREEDFLWHSLMHKSR